MTCDQIEELLSDLIDDDLSDGVRAAVESHVAGCRRCAASHRALLRTVRFVRANADARLAAGTPGGVYSDFTRATMDDTFGPSPQQILVRAITGIVAEFEIEVQPPARRPEGESK
jgi:anti-sigma factor RsiW